MYATLNIIITYTSIFEMLSFTHFKDVAGTPKYKDLSRDSDHAR